MKKQSVGRLRRPPQGLSKEAGNCTRKRQGELSEIAFALKATRLGFRIFEPVGDSQRYDFILDAGQHLWRIQVKSTGGVIGCQDNDRGYIINAYWASRGHVPYSADQIDFLAAHVISYDVWYIIPVEAFVPRTSLPLYPAPDSKIVGRYEKYREVRGANPAIHCHPERSVIVRRTVMRSRGTLRLPALDKELAGSSPHDLRWARYMVRMPLGGKSRRRESWVLSTPGMDSRASPFPPLKMTGRKVRRGKRRFQNRAISHFSRCRHRHTPATNRIV